MRSLEPKHYVLLGGFLASLSIQLAGVQHGWADVLTPTFVSGVIAQLGVLIGALYARAPGATGELRDRRDPGSSDNAIKDPSRLPVWMLPATLALSIIGGGLIFDACHAPVTITTPAGQAAYKADQVVVRLQEISKVVIGGTGTNPGQISPADAFAIVEWISGDAHGNPPTTGVLQAVQTTIGQGWKAAAKQGWTGKIRGLFGKYPSLKPYVDVVDVILEVI